MLRQFLFILVLISLGHHCLAQKVKFSGQVFDSDSADYLPFSAVVLTQNERQTCATAANVDGKFEFDSIPPGKYGLMIRAVGYNTLSDSLFISRKDSIKIKNFFLETQVEQVEELHLLPYFNKPVKKKKKT